VARDVLPDLLRQGGFVVDVVPAYQTRIVGEAARSAIRASFEQREIDAVLFTSSSTVENACAALGERATELLASVAVGSIGPVTTATAERLGVHVDVMSQVYTVDGVLQALGQHFSSATLAPQ
jgi:uroporphyrinogen III methyltransferase/synthase